MWGYFVALWALMSTVMVTTIFSEIVRGLLVHGKVRKDTKFRAGLVAWLMRIEMKKSGWIYFYFAGAAYNLAIAALLLWLPRHPLVQQTLSMLQSDPTDAAPTLILMKPEAITVIGLLGVQDTRRFFESVFITEFGDAKMHVALLVAGLIHYLGIAPSVLSSPHSRVLLDETSVIHSAYHLAGLGLFVYASYHQYLCNKLLATQKAASDGKHVVPKGDWFNHVRCALYSAEILLYLAFSVICGLQNAMVNLVFGWVVLNQSICALYAKQWYDDKFRDQKMPKWTLVPGIW